jgi:tetratricopeptide (TPR) repeat protein
MSAPMLGAFLLAACSAPETARLVESPGQLPPRVELISVPFYPQTEFFCGPAALAMALSWSGLPETPESVASQVYTPGRRGTLAADVVSAARRRGRLAVEVRDLDGLLAEIAAGHPVIVLQNLALEWMPQWHFAVAVGYDLPRREIVLHTGTTERRATSLDAFERTWDRAGKWGVVTLPPDRLPAATDRQTILLAAAGLERADRYDAAVQAYEAIAKRWPYELVALIGQGNAWFSLERFDAAERAYRTVISRDPELAGVWNNLAHALHRQGRRDEAIEAARNALRNAKGDVTAYRDTLREVSR